MAKGWLDICSKGSILQMFNPAGSPAGACWAARWMGPGQEEPAVEEEGSTHAPHAS